MGIYRSFGGQQPVKPLQVANKGGDSPAPTYLKSSHLVQDDSIRRHLAEELEKKKNFDSSKLKVENNFKDEFDMPNPK